MNIYNEKVRFTNADWSDFFRSDYVSSKSGETFSEVLTRYLDEVQVKCSGKQIEIARLSGIKTSLISKFKTGTRVPSLNAIVSLCIAMKLTPDRSEHLLYTAGYVLNDSKDYIVRPFRESC